MDLAITESIKQDPHLWFVSVNEADITNNADPLVSHMIQAVRDAYGEQIILNQVIVINEDVGETFDVQSIIKGFRLGIPDPSSEEKKPKQLRNYRSEAAEFFAREALRILHQVITPLPLQACKGNAIQPLLGFDGWGILQLPDESTALVLMQVKGSDDQDSPPGVCAELVDECKKVKFSSKEIAHSISACLILVQGTDIAVHLLKMLGQLGKGKLPPLVISPVIVRGNITPKLSDIQPLLDISHEFLPAIGRGISIGIGIELEQFGRHLFTEAQKSS